MSKNWRDFINKAFADMEHKRLPHLVIDIRNNEGGDDEVVEYVVKAIAKKPVMADPLMKMARYKVIPDDIQPYLCSWNDDYKKTSLKKKDPVDGLYELKNSGEPRNIPAQKKCIQGQSISFGK